MIRLPEVECCVTVGVDTHSEVHVVAVLDERGGRLGVESFPSTSTGHQQLERWCREHGTIDAVGIEGTGAWGAGLARHLTAAGYEVIEVDRPDRQARRRHGKSDPIDADAAARAVQAGRATVTPKTRNGPVESIRALRVARNSAIKARTQAANQLHSLVASAPDVLRDKLRQLSIAKLVNVAARWHPGDPADFAQGTRLALRSIARRYIDLTEEIDQLDAALRPLVTTVAPNLVARFGVGIDTAGQLLVTAGDNPHRLRSEASFAALCGVAPIPASSGKTNRHRLSRGGDRAANKALYTIVLCRLRWDSRTKAYVQRRTAQGRSNRDVIRCLKRAVAREMFQELTRPPLDRP